MTPVLAMLHALAESRSARQTLWLHQARDRGASSIRRRGPSPDARAHGRPQPVCYGSPVQATIAGTSTARVTSRSVLDEVGIPRDADVCLCRSDPLHARHERGACRAGVAPARIHVELFNGGESMTPGVVGTVTRPPHRRHDAGAVPAGIVRAKRILHTGSDRLPEPPGAGRSV